jgi:hypothetical protein
MSHTVATLTRPRPSESRKTPPKVEASGRAAASNASHDLTRDRHRAVLMAELHRMRTRVKRMKATELRHRELVELLHVVLSDRAFVRVLAEQGFTTMPRLIMEHLSGTVGTRTIAAENPHESEGARSKVNGLCQKAAAILAGYELPAVTITAMRSMSPQRQVEVAHEMQAGNNCTVEFAHALLAATPKVLRMAGRRICQDDEARAAVLSSIERSLRKLHLQAQALEPEHNDNLVYLALGGGVARAWTGSDVVMAWLRTQSPRYAAFLGKLATEAGRASKASKRPLKLSYA